MGSSNNASREASASEAQRRSQVEDAQRQIEAIYSAPGRETDIRDVEGAARDYLQGDLDRQSKRTARELKFALARDGTTMGSRDVDQNRELAENFLRGSIEVQRRAGAAGNSLRQADQASKLGLFSMAQQGLDMTTAARQAGESMRSNIAGAKADALQTGLGDLFSQFGKTYTASRERSKERRNEMQFNPYASAMPPGGYEWS